MSRRMIGVSLRAGMRAAFLAVIAAAFATTAPADRLLEALPSFDVGNGPSAVVAADFTGDGIADLAVANRDDNTVSLLPGTGFGHFLTQQATAVILSPTSLGAGDIDGDGLRDLVVASRQPGEITILRNTGGGVFVRTQTLKIGGSPSSIAMGDFDGDGAWDFVVSRETFDSVALYRGDPTGVVTGPFLMEAGDKPAQVIAVDIEGDGDLDLVTANLGGSDFSVIRNNGAGEFGFPLVYPTANPPNGVAAADTNGDGFADVVLISAEADTAAFHLNLGNGTFGAASLYFAGVEPRAIVAANLDNDAFADFAIVATYQTEESTLLPMLSFGNGTFRADRFFGVPGLPTALAAVDADRDGSIDLAIIDGSDTIVSLAHGNGAGWFAAAWLFRGTGSVSGGSLDANGDGLVDLVMSGNGTAATGVAVFQGDHRGVLVPTTVVNPGTSYNVVGGADLDNDGYDELAALTTGGSLELYRNQGDGSFEFVSTASSGTNGNLRFADLNSDGLLDLAYRGTTGVAIYVNTDPPSLVRSGSLILPNSGIAIWDVEGAMGPDVVLSQNASPGAVIWYNTGNPANPYSTPTNITDMVPLHDVGATDLDRDGDLDLLGVASSPARVVFRARTASGFGDHVFLSTAISGYQTSAVGDLDGDGLADIAVGTQGGVHVHRTAGPSVPTSVEPIASSRGLARPVITRVPGSPGVGVIATRSSPNPARVHFYRNSTPWVVRVEVAGPRAVDVHFSEPMAGAVLDRFSYQVGGAGAGTLSTFPDQVSGLSAYAVLLSWAGGEMGGGADITVSVARAVTDLRGNAVGFVTSATAPGGGIGGAAPVSTIAAVAPGMAVAPIAGSIAANDPDGSGIASIDLYARKEGGVWGGVATLAGDTFSFLPTEGSGRYFLQSVARDGAGNTEAIPVGETGEGDATVTFNAVENAPLTLDVAAGGRAFFPMSGAFGVEIDFATATSGGAITVFRTLDPSPSAPPLDGERLIDESVTIDGTFAGTASLAWTYDPASAEGVNGPVSMLFQREDLVVINQFTVTPTDGTTLRVDGLTSFSEWFAGNAGLVTAETTGMSVR